MSVNLSLPPLRARPVEAPVLALRLEDAARSVGLSTRTLRRLVERGTLPASRIGRALLFKVGDLDALLSRNRIGGDE